MTIVDTSVATVDLRTGEKPHGSQETALAARHEVYAHIAQLERQLSTTLGKLDPTRRPQAANEFARPHVLSSQELEATRAALMGRVAEAEGLVARQSADQADARALLKRMNEMPAHFRWATVTSREMGQRECREWQSVPVLGPIGMLSAWWRIRMSSGCP